MRFRPMILGLALASLAAGPNWAQGWGEPQSNFIPRSGPEAERIASVTMPTSVFSAAEVFETHPAGAATRLDQTGAAAFSTPSGNMAANRLLDFELGRALFEKLWVTAPASTTSSDGVGPLYNARACASCHVGNGRGHPPEAAGDTGVSMVLHLSIPRLASDLAPDLLTHMSNAPEPVYGNQLQDKSVAGIAAEGRMRIRYEDVPVELGDGSVVSLRRPQYTIADPAYGPLHPLAQISPRVAPQMIGLGLLEAIPETDILALADAADADRDGISGRASRVWSQEYGQWMLGRFGYKAGAATITAQSAAAASGDIGLSTPLAPAHWGDCTAAQADCRAAPHGGTGSDEALEAPTTVMALIVFYARNLAVPARRTIANPEVLRGKEVFYTAGCTACHRPKFVTHRLPDRPEQSFQLIWPYSDLLLHDMGEGLADNRPEWGATGREWRTAPLWGIGLTETISGRATFLHDGRARTLLEAILWHGGEAEAARETVRLMGAADRTALITFLETL